MKESKFALSALYSQLPIMLSAQQRPIKIEPMSSDWPDRTTQSIGRRLLEPPIDVAVKEYVANKEHNHDRYH